MLKEPYLFCQKTGGLPAKLLKVAIGAFAADQQLPAQVKAGKTHVAGGVGLLALIADVNSERLGCGKADELLDILKRTDPNAEFLHKIPPSSLYKRQFFVYNGGRVS
jgi:hypothetical protein